MNLSVANSKVKSDVGRQRDHNEDAAVEVDPLFMLADGMGGAQAGEVASQTAVKVFSAGAGKEGTPEARLTKLAKQANSEIYELAQEDQSKRGMGTTLTAALVEGDGVTVAHVGDSRVYRMRDGELEQLTHDHSLVAELERSGQIDPEDAVDHPSKSVITRALGPEPDVEVDAHTHKGRPDDTYLMCSDGLTDMVTDDEIAAILKSARSLEDASESLVRAANQSGGRTTSLSCCSRWRRARTSQRTRRSRRTRWSGDSRRRMCTTRWRSRRRPAERRQFPGSGPSPRSR